MPKYEFMCEECDGSDFPCKLEINTPKGKLIDTHPDTCILSNCPRRKNVKWKTVMIWEEGI